MPLFQFYFTHNIIASAIRMHLYELSITFERVILGLLFYLFYNRYWVMFPMTKSMFFPIRGENVQFKEQKKVLWLHCAIANRIFVFQTWRCGIEWNVKGVEWFGYWIFCCIWLCYTVRDFFLILNKIPNSWDRVMFPKCWEENPGSFNHNFVAFITITPWIYHTFYEFLKIIWQGGPLVPESS